MLCLSRCPVRYRFSVATISANNFGVTIYAKMLKQNNFHQKCRKGVTVTAKNEQQSPPFLLKMGCESLLLRSAMAVTQLFLVRNSAIDLVWSQHCGIAQVRMPTFDCYQRTNFFQHYLLWYRYCIRQGVLFIYLSTSENLLWSNITIFMFKFNYWSWFCQYVLHAMFFSVNVVDTESRISYVFL